MRSLPQRLEVHPATREAAQEDGDGRLSSFGVTNGGGYAVVFHGWPQSRQLGPPARCAFARGVIEAAGGVTSHPGVHNGEGGFGGESTDGESGDGQPIDVGGGSAGVVA